MALLDSLGPPRHVATRTSSTTLVAAVFLAVFGVRLLVFLAWMLWLPFAFVIDFLVGFVCGLLDKTER